MPTYEATLPQATGAIAVTARPCRHLTGPAIRDPNGLMLTRIKTALGICARLHELITM
jgi:hypothetical protein